MFPIAASPLSDVYTLSRLRVKTQWKIPRGFKSECDGYVDFPLADNRTYISPLTGKISPLYSWHAYQFAASLFRQRVCNDYAKTRTSRSGLVQMPTLPPPPKESTTRTSHCERHIHSLRTTEKCSHLTEAQDEDRNPRLEHMPRLVPNSPFRRFATHLPSKYRGLS